MTSTDLFGFLYGIGLVQGAALAGVLLFARSGHRLANVIMAVLVVAIALSVLQKWMILQGLWVEHPRFAFVIHPLRYAWGPLLYLYAYSLTGGQLNLRQWWHFLPAILFSSLEHMNLRWLRALTIACLVFLGSVLVFNRVPFLMTEYFDRNTPVANGHSILLVILLYGIAISALFQPSLISGVMQALDSEAVWEKEREHRPTAPDANNSIVSDHAATGVLKTTVSTSDPGRIPRMPSVIRSGSWTPCRMVNSTWIAT